MLRRASATLLAHFLLFAICTIVCFGQGPQPGEPSFSPIEGHGYYSINLQNLNIGVTIPVRSKTSFGTAILSSSGDYVFVYSGQWFPTGIALGYVDVGLLNVTITGSQLTGTCNGQPDHTLFGNLYVTDVHGTYHPFPTSFKVDQAGCYTGGTVTTTDDSGYTAVITGNATAVSYTLYSRSGHYTVGQINPAYLGVAKDVDPNGNVIQKSGYPYLFSGDFTDSLNTTALSASASGYNLIFTYKDSGSNTVTTTVNQSTFPIKTAFGCGLIEATGSAYPMPTSVVWASGTSQQATLGFAYESTPGNPGYYTGRLASLTLPTGGQVTFAYSSGNGSNGINCDGTPGTLTRTTPDGRWTYVHTPPATGSSISTTTVTDPLGNETDYTFVSQVLIAVVHKDSHGNWLATENICYNSNYSGCTSPSSISFPITLRDVYSGYNAWGNHYVVNEESYDSYGNVVDSKLYTNVAIGSAPSTGTLLSEIWTPRGTESGPNCVAVGNYIQDRLCAVNVYDGSGNAKASTGFQYDSHGNRTASGRWTGPATNRYLQTFDAYNQNGTPHTVTDINGTITTYTSYGCNAMLLTGFSVTVGSQTLTGSKAWDPNCNGGVVVSSIDANSQTSTVAYADPFWRLTSATDPLNNTTTTSYNTNFVGTQLSFGSTLVDSGSGLDSVGRLIVSTSETGQNTGQWYVNPITYDANGRHSRTYMPCITSGSWACSTPYTLINYDALGRVSSVVDGAGNTVVSYTYTAVNANGRNTVDVLITGGGKQTNLEINEFGQIFSVCEVSTQSGSGACGQTVAYNGFKTDYVYDTLGNLTNVIANPGQTQTRTFTVDALSRLLTEAHPEQSSNTTTYVYDTDSTCGTYTGDLVRKTDAVGNVTCFQYDGLHRVTKAYVSSGSYASTSPDQCFVYDSATVNGTAMQYTKGRLSEAYTVAHGAGCAAAKITDEGFSYNKRGDLADFYESTPHSGGYYHTTADYFPNGKLKSLSGVPGQSAIAYGVDSMGRACSALKGSTPPAPCPATPGSTSLVNSVAYNPAGQVTDINLGLGDKDDYVYDGSTGHMTQYQFTVGSTPKTLTGTLYWNPNGTLNKHDIVDNLSMQTQSCDTISYDDLGRLSAYNCGSAWGQNFTYDRYGNITKTGSISWGCTSCYTASTNHYNSSLSPLIQYDANGNLLNDSYATYTWNAFGRPATIVSSSNNLTLTYDAFGRLVEKQNGSTYNEILYGASGNLGLMSGQNTYSVDFPLPGGVSYRTWSGGGFLHRDWLGSGRMDTLISSRTVYSATAYAPFGENYAQSGVNDNFTGDLDYLLQYDKDPSGGGGFADTRARELRAKQGRWISPDPAGLGAVDLANPQTWNRYAYVTNNPLSFVDPTGLGPCSDEQNPAICNGTGYSFALSVLLGFGTWDSFDILNFAFSGAEQVAVPTGGSIPLITDGDSLQVALLPDTADAEAQEVGIHWVYPNIGALSLLSWPHFKGQTPYLPNDPGANKPTQTPRQQCVAQAQQTFNNTMDQINSQSILPSVTEGAAFGTLAGAAWGCFVGYPAFPLPELAQVACEETYGASALIPAINGGISGGGAAATKWFLRQSALMSNAQNTFTQQVQNVCSKLPG